MFSPYHCHNETNICFTSNLMQIFYDISFRNNFTESENRQKTKTEMKN